MIKRFLFLAAAATVLLATIPAAAQAYVGPGAGISLLSALWALLAVIGSAILYVVLWPIRRWRKLRKQRREPKDVPGESVTPPERSDAVGKDDDSGAKGQGR